MANSFGNEYWIFTPDGTFKEAWGIPGTGPAQFDFSSHRTEDQSVGAIAFAPDGSFYVADNGNRRIQRFDADRKYAGMWGSFGTADGQFANPFGIAVAGDTVYVADDDRGDVQAFTKGGTYLRTFGRIISAAGIFIAADKDGNLYRSGGEANSVISKYDPTGAFVADFDIGPPGAFAAGLAVDTAGNVYANIYSAGRIQLISLSPLGDRLGAWTGGDQTLAVDPSGTAVYEAGEQKPASLSKFALPTP